MAGVTIVPTDRELKAIDLSSNETRDLIREAEANDAADRALTIMQALRKYKKAMFWSMFMSTTLIMEGYDVVIVCESSAVRGGRLLTFRYQITSFYGQTQFLERFGVADSDTGKKLISPAWQSGLSNSALVGQLAGLIINGFCQDRFGCRKTMMFFLAWMAAAIFIVFFAPSLSVLAFGEAMCGISWGVFQVNTTTVSY